jgi:hypothetical protein
VLRPSFCRAMLDSYTRYVTSFEVIPLRVIMRCRRASMLMVAETLKEGEAETHGKQGQCHQRRTEPSECFMSSPSILCGYDGKEISC